MGPLPGLLPHWRQVATPLQARNRGAEHHECAELMRELSAGSAQEAIRGVLEEYKDSGGEIPWRNTCGGDIPAGATHKWVIVDA